MSFKKSKLGELAAIKGGKRLPKGESFSEVATKHPYIRARDIGEGRITFTDPIYLTQEMATKLQRYTVKHGDVCITIVGANVGDVGAVPESLNGANLTENAVKVVAKSGVEPGFLKYALLTNDAQDQMKVLAGGAAQPKLGIYKVETVEIPSPSSFVQQKIASILFAYDDLIENNLRRIKILEEMAQNLYREWFVKFRFPSHEQVRTVDSSLGKIPEGWQATTIGAVTSYINRGVAPKYDDSSPSLVINQKCIRDRKLNLNLARRHKSRVIDEKYVELGDVLINSTGVGTLGRVTQVCEELNDVTVDTHVSIVRPVSVGDIDFLGLALIDLEPHFESLGAGATGQTELRRDRIGETEIILPPPEIRNHFSELVSPIRKLALNLAARNEVLRQSRDLLLPKLISGELDVSTLSIDTGQEAA